MSTASRLLSLVWWLLLMALLSCGGQEREQNGTPAKVNALTPREHSKAVVERLRSDDPATREQACQELERMGATAISLLEELSRDMDLEVRVRAGQTLDRMRRRVRVVSVRPATVRSTLELKNTAIRDAVRRVFLPYGLKCQVEDTVGGWVSLTLRDASLWESLDTFCAAASLSPGSFYLGGPDWSFGRSGDDRGLRCCDVDDARVVVKARRRRLEPSGVFVDLHLLLPPRSLLLSCRLDGLKLTDDGGRELRVVDLHCDASRLRARTWGTLVGGRVATVTVAATDVERGASLQLTGVLVLVYARDIDHIAMDVGHRQPGRLGKWRLAMLRAEEGVAEWEGEVAFEGADLGSEWRDLRFWLEDGDGRWVADLTATAVAESTIRLQGRRATGQPRAARVVVGRYLGEEEVPQRFVIGDVSVPE